MDGENIDTNDMKTIVWTDNILSVFGAKTPFTPDKCGRGLSGVCKDLQKSL